LQNLRFPKYKARAKTMQAQNDPKVQQQRVNVSVDSSAMSFFSVSVRRMQKNIFALFDTDLLPTSLP
jgi:hypothetical protein